MKNRFAEMDCFVLAGGLRNPVEDFQRVGDLTRLEKGYRRYAAVFERVVLVLKKEQARERYLNYPYVCDEQAERGAAVGVATALTRANSEAVFIGSSHIADFPLELVVDLVRRYNGELFLGYHDSARPESRQPLFGVFNRRLLSWLADIRHDSPELADLLNREGRLMPLPPGAADRLGLS